MNYREYDNFKKTEMTGYSSKSSVSNSYQDPSLKTSNSNNNSQVLSQRIKRSSNIFLNEDFHLQKQIRNYSITNREPLKTSISVQNKNQKFSNNAILLISSLKETHKKEKEELISRIISLERELENQKEIFEEYIQKIQNNIDEIDKIRSNKMQIEKEEYELNLKTLEEKKNIEIDMLKDEIEKYKKDKEKVLEEKHLIQKESNEKINELQIELKEKNIEIDNFQREINEELENLKQDYQNKLDEIANSFGNQIQYEQSEKKKNFDILNYYKEQYILLNQRLEINEKKFQEKIFEKNKENEILRKELVFFQEQSKKLYEEARQYIKENEIMMMSLKGQKGEISKNIIESDSLKLKINSLYDVLYNISQMYNQLFLEKDTLLKQYDTLLTENENLKREKSEDDHM